MEGNCYLLVSKGLRRFEVKRIMGNRVRRTVLTAASGITTCAACLSDTPPSCLSRSVDATPASTAYQSESNAMSKSLGLTHTA